MLHTNLDSMALFLLRKGSLKGDLRKNEGRKNDVKAGDFKEIVTKNRKKRKKSTFSERSSNLKSNFK